MDLPGVHFGVHLGHEMHTRAPFVPISANSSFSPLAQKSPVI